jgi:TPR repeat protein
MAWAKGHCVTLGAHIGGDYVTKQHVVDDLLAFMQRHGFIRDATIDAVLGDCARMKGAFVQQLCERARGGHIGDIVALGIAFALGRDVERDDGFAARLFRLAADYGSPHGQYELAAFVREGRGGLPRDPQEAVRLLRLAAGQDYALAWNDLAWAYRDGIGVAPDDAEAAQLFRRAALNRNPWAMASLGQFLRSGRGGLPRDPDVALRLFKTSALLGNPWGQFSLGGMLERGEAVPADRAAALALYRKAAAQAWDGSAGAVAAVKRLEAGH